MRKDEALVLRGWWRYISSPSSDCDDDAEDTVGVDGGVEKVSLSGESIALVLMFLVMKRGLGCGMGMLE